MAIEERELAAPPVEAKDYEQWKKWASDNASKAFGAWLEKPPWSRKSDEARIRHHFQIRATIAYWAGHSVDPQEEVEVALRFMKRARSAPPSVVRASRLLTEDLLFKQGTTTAAVLYFSAGWAWMLRDVDPEFAKKCWRALVHARWQTDSSSMIELVKVLAGEEGVLSGERSIASLAQERDEDGGHRNSARELLESVAALQFGVDRIERLNGQTTPKSKPVVEGADSALLKLAQWYVEDEHDEIYAREVIRYAEGITYSTKTRTSFAKVVQDRVWDRDFDEAYDWARQIKRPDHIKDEVQKAIEASQPEHAIRLAHAVIVYENTRVPPRTKRKNALKDAKDKIVRLKLPEGSLEWSACAQFAVLSSRTDGSTAESRNLVHAIHNDLKFCGGRDAPLSDIRDELADWYRAQDPLTAVRARHDRVQSATGLSDGEKRAREEVQAWFASRLQPPSPSAWESARNVMTKPLSELGADPFRSVRSSAFSTT